MSRRLIERARCAECHMLVSTFVDTTEHGHAATCSEFVAAPDGNPILAPRPAP